MAIVWGAVVYFLLIAFLHADAKTSHPVPTYFKRIHKNGSIVDVNDPQNRLRFGKQIREHLSSGANLIVTPSYVTNGATVNVSWNGIPKANYTDFIALYCPKDEISSEYLDYFYVTQSSTYASGYGWYTVVVYNMRTTCEFRYYQESYIHVATSNELKFKGGIYVPLQGHIALTGDPTQMRVMWVSGTGKVLFFISGVKTNG